MVTRRRIVEKDFDGDLRCNPSLNNGLCVIHNTYASNPQRKTSEGYCRMSSARRLLIREAKEALMNQTRTITSPNAYSTFQPLRSAIVRPAPSPRRSIVTMNKDDDLTSWKQSFSKSKHFDPKCVERLRAWTQFRDLKKIVDEGAIAITHNDVPVDAIVSPAGFIPTSPAATKMSH
ncbi:hypothetical protein HYC85_015535 [Camellia sinensis]|uniref:Uncharacterized protein n=1 Tax=Camellia sinensis TaxID=4442 RepID=A0A7J7GY23_CAMSI|nr:hypothetical protein HYC85_015535 [Camellia sinensis]